MTAYNVRNGNRLIIVEWKEERRKIREMSIKDDASECTLSHRLSVSSFLPKTGFFYIYLHTKAETIFISESR